MCYERFRNKCKDAWCEMHIWELYKDIQVFLRITKSENVGPDVSQALKRSKRLWIWAQVYIWSCFRSTCSVFKNLGLRRDSEGALVRWRKGKAKQSKCPLNIEHPHTQRLAHERSRRAVFYHALTTHSTYPSQKVWPFGPACVTVMKGNLAPVEKGYAHLWNYQSRHELGTISEISQAILSVVYVLRRSGAPVDISLLWTCLRHRSYHSTAFSVPQNLKSCTWKSFRFIMKITPRCGKLELSIVVALTTQSHARH